MTAPKQATTATKITNDPSAPQAAATGAASSQSGQAKLARPDYPAWSQRKASLIGGIALLLLAVLAGLANFGVVEVLVTPGDAARTAKDLIDSEPLFRSGIAGLLVVVILDIVVACSLLAVFESVNRNVAIMAAVFRIAYSAVFLVAISQLVSTLSLLGEPDEALRAVDLSDLDILDLNNIVAYFNYINRVANGLGLKTEIPSEHARRALPR